MDVKAPLIRRRFRNQNLKTRTPAAATLVQSSPVLWHARDKGHRSAPSGKRARTGMIKSPCGIKSDCTARESQLKHKLERRKDSCQWDGWHILA